DQLAVTTTVAREGVLLESYNFCIGTSGGFVSPRNFTVTDPQNLPAGLSLTPGTGCLSGTAKTAGSYSFHVRVTDSSTPQQVVPPANQPGQLITLHVSAVDANVFSSVGTTVTLDSSRRFAQVMMASGSPLLTA